MGMYLGNQPVRIIERSKNQLLRFPYFDRTLTTNGVKCIVNADGTVILNGTATAISQFRFAVNSQLPVGVYTVSVGGEYIVRVAKNSAWYGEGKTCKITVDNPNDKWNFYVFFLNGEVFNNLKLYPMLNDGPVAKPFEPYNRYFRIRTGIRARNPLNLIPFPYAEQSRVVNGVRFTINNDGSVTVKREESLGKSSLFVLGRNLNLKTNTPYTISGGKTVSNGYIAVNSRKYNSQGSDTYWIDSTGNSATGMLQDGERFNYISIYVSATSMEVGESVLIYTMLFEGETTKSYFIID